MHPHTSSCRSAASFSGFIQIRGYKKLTWGIVTEEQGKYLNMGLANSKEAFGGEYSINRIYSKILK